MVNVHSSGRTFFNMNLVSEISLKWELKNVYPLIKRLFSTSKVSNVPIAGRQKHFFGFKNKTIFLEKINQGSDYPGFTLLHENFAVSWGKIAFRSILISRFRQIDEFRSSSKK